MHRTPCARNIMVFRFRSVIYIPAVPDILLTKQKDWLKSIGLSYDKTTERLETIDEQIQLMIDNIQETISEASAV